MIGTYYRFNNGDVTAETGEMTRRAKIYSHKTGKYLQVENKKINANALALDKYGNSNQAGTYIDRYTNYFTYLPTEHTIKLHHSVKNTILRQCM